MAPLSRTLKDRSRLQADLTLLLVAAIWGSAFVAQRVAAQQMGTYLFNGLRFILAVLVLLPLARSRADRRQAISPRDWAAIGLAGLLLFLGATFQQLGLRHTTAGNAGFITGLYVVLIPILLAVVGRQRPRRQVWVASLLAAGGLFLLSTGGTFRLAPGDGLELVGAFMWALHVIWIGRLVQRLPILPLAIGQNLICGLFSLGASALSEANTLPMLLGAWFPLVYTAVFSIGVGYTLQASAQRHAPPADAAIILSLEAVFAALGGWLWLDERLSALQLVGCGLIFGGMLLAQFRGEDL
jgi:drug/metabolite transporter (DMT)-like permease